MVPVLTYGILGPLIVRRGETDIPVAGVRDRTVLARLLLSLGEAVSKDQLIDALYGDSPRKTASTQIHGAIKRLRFLMGATSIETNAGGYVLVAPPEALDAYIFERLVILARTALRAGRTGDAARDLNRALELWRGPALTGFDGEIFATEARRWEELRLAAVEERVEVQLELGRYTEMIPELHRLTAIHPMRERFAGQLMLALYRSQRTTEALRTYSDLRNRLVDELGVDPSPDLQHLYEQILQQDSALHQSPEPAFTPQQLPAGLPTMIGRDGELKQAMMALTPAQRRHLPVVVILGNGGVGKTTLALEVAHLLTDNYPDGQLFANLGGASPRPAKPHDVLGRFLRSLGVSGPAIPADPEERSELFRSLSARKRLLLVLDDAADAQQIAPLLPGSAGCAVIVTSRGDAPQFHGVTLIALQPFDGDDARALLAQSAGTERMAAEPEAVEQVIERCLGLPLALAIVGSRLAARPTWQISKVAARLTGRRRILSELREVEPVLEWAYGMLDEENRSLLRRLGLLGQRGVSVWMAAALADISLPAAEERLDQLGEAGFLSPTGVRGYEGMTYTCHDLVLAVAHDRAMKEDSPQERSAALERSFGALLSMSDAAYVAVRGGHWGIVRGSARRWHPPDPWLERLPSGWAPAWLESQPARISAATQQAAELGETEYCWELALALFPLLESGGHFEVWRSITDSALAAARGEGDVRGEAAMLYSQGHRATIRHDMGEARHLLERSAELFRRLGDAGGEGLALSDLAAISRTGGDLHAAEKTYARAATLLAEAGDRAGEAGAVHGIAKIYLDRHADGTARIYLGKARLLVHEAGNLGLEAQILHSMAVLDAHAGHLDTAERGFQHALRLIRSLDHHVGTAFILIDLGTLQLGRGERHAGFLNLLEGCELAQIAGDRRTEAKARYALASEYVNCGEMTLAAAEYAMAGELYRALGDEAGAARVQEGSAKLARAVP
ncbi:AfsR/SARP family transcriptional regulator [Nonomuraea candida]|uniref:AfsR/SARP family transcriptional regulator n=1 Tax=Nonomuraea candida TaxID=359159 RepID=UPI0014702571|nr:BTAD domain-containing putative transcriptional regulator [Nonomuraea candida]